MNDNEERMVEWAARIFSAVLLLSLIWALSGCSYRYIPVETVRHDSVLMHRIEKDSIFVRDSLYIREKGDTVFVDKHKYIYKYLLKTDTCYIVRTDSVTVPFPVECRLTWWQKVRMDLGGYLFVIGAGYVVYRIIRWIVKRTRKRN